MQKENTKGNIIEKLKQELMDRYMILMMVILGIYTLIFTFYIYDKTMSWYLAGGIIFCSYSYFLVRKKYSINLIVCLYLILAPLYNFYIMLAFWNNSVASFCWLLPIPLGAYIFFSSKKVLVYTAYSLSHLMAGYIIANNFDLNFPHHTQKEVLFTDTILFISNIMVVTLLIYYKDKIRKIEILSGMNNEELPKINLNNTETSLKDNDVESMERLFERIESIMIHDMHFKDVKYNLSKLSTALNVNSSYISKAIRYKGYPHFSSYLNRYRINYVKELFTETNFQKTTLMYVYTEAGFSNQSTFNRVFKQIEGITPSEYVMHNHMNNSIA